MTAKQQSDPVKPSGVHTSLSALGVSMVLLLIPLVNAVIQNIRIGAAGKSSLMLGLIFWPIGLIIGCIAVLSIAKQELNDRKKR